MSIFDDIIGKNADDRLAEEMLYAEAMREIEQGIRRDGLWGKATRTLRHQAGFCMKRAG